MNITKENNQHYGKFFETAVCSIINGKEELYDKYDFTDEEKQIMMSHAQEVADFINGNSCEWVGNKTGIADCDIIVDGTRHIELKYVSDGRGTYWNTSMYYLDKFGFNFKDYMTKYDLYGAISKLGIEPNRKNNSPVNQKTSSYIRNYMTDLYKEYVVPIDEEMRRGLVDDLVEYFINNPDDLVTFTEDMLNKNSSTGKKSKPDEIIIYNYTKNKIFTVDFNKQIQDRVIYKTDKGLSIDNVHIAISWSNGLGLYNPTLRVFFRKEKE